MAVGLAAAPERDSAILITEYLAYSIQYRRLLMRFPLGPGPYRDRLLDAMASLLVDLHRAGVYWGDCSLANTLFRRDGDKIQAYLVDAETSEIHPELSDGQRCLRPRHPGRERRVRPGRPRRRCRAATKRSTTRSPRPRPSAPATRAVWDELHLEPELPPGDRHAIRARIRRLNELGFAIDELTLEPTSPDRRRGPPAGGRGKPAVPRPRAPEADRAGRPRGPGAAAAQRHPRVPGLAGVLEPQRRIPTDVAADRWLEEVLEPAIAALVPAIGPLRDPLQAYCDVLEEKWLLSEAAGHDVGLEAAMAGYLDLGAPAPEAGATLADSSIALDIDWSGGLDRRPATTTRADRRPLITLDGGSARPSMAPSRMQTAGGGRDRARSSGSSGLVKRYGDVQAVDGIDFEVAGGEVFGLLGPNGAGKTTTVEILEGLRSPDGGQATVLGVDVATGADSLKPRIGVSLQTAALYPKLTVVEVIDLFRSFYPRPRPTAELIDDARARRAAQCPDPRAVGRAATAPGRRARPGQRSGAHLPRRADDRPRPGSPPIPLGPDSRAQGGRSHDPADDALHGGGGGPVRSAGDHGPRPDPRDGHGRRAHLEALQRACRPVRPDRRAAATLSLRALPAVSSVKHDARRDAALHPRRGRHDRRPPRADRSRATSNRRTWASAGPPSRTSSST